MHKPTRIHSGISSGYVPTLVRMDQMGHPGSEAIIPDLGIIAMRLYRIESGNILALNASLYMARSCGTSTVVNV
ncbi:hypothetical protein NDU88_004902 [Pleurodeles waltl]|uniref:Uncharacterized protein n=1 Tax=Pleurodeles waltl TaxID=8319 RepID=A0AAV7SK73_PLEWA|nr:hypothetical protein NDU88_004902 [Pleurodeles waltl]